MTHVISDSEVEEVNTTPSKPKPRRVAMRRKVEIEDDSDDEADFFVVKRAYEQAETEEQLFLARNEDQSKTAFSQETEASNYAGGISSGGSSEDEEYVEMVFKRKHPDDEDGVDNVQRQQRSRSVSLTPPPQLLPLPPADASSASTSRRATKAQADGISRHPDVFVLDSDSDSAEPQPKPRPQRNVRRNHSSNIKDLDPALQAAVRHDDIGSPHRGGPETASGSGHLLDKVQIEFKFIYDDTFVMVEVPGMWEGKRWGRVKPHEREKIIKKLSQCIAVVAYVSDSVDNAVRAFSDNFPINIMALDPILMVNRMRVFTTVSIGSLGTRPVHYIDIYPRSVYNRVREKEAVERTVQALEQEQTMRDLELAKQLRENVAASNEMGSGGAPSQEVDAAVDAIRIKIRDRSGKDVLLQVSRTTAVQAVIDNYKKIAKVDAKVRLEFDDEGLDPTSKIGDTEIEDDDMLTAFWS
ncbi:hypothetical protein GGI11_000318 [Coemansia sp. RSA 2049]|nr:hypothetical protein H4217_006213 [Coemansia sp. RSA 1939]KAJ2525084.1 hypothetical protein GGI11_000318 [Coemansia sp. RSA 2049]KAJ2606032.1 hypothetical protein EV177_006021 [Coemansia sp. RSA 1804]KAJ2684711.1 hypothetical protein GGH99_003964 [Coemansia sp. RSA 1285]